MAILKKAQKKEIKANVVAAGGSKKTARKAVASKAKELRGGVSRVGSVLRGAANIGATIIPGVGGAVLGGISQKLANKDEARRANNPLPLEDNTLIRPNTQNNPIGDNKPAIPDPITEVPPTLGGARPPMSPTPSIASNQQEAEEDIIRSERAANTPTNRLFAPEKDNSKEKEKKDMQRRLMIIIAVIVLLVVLYLLTRKK